MISKFTSPFFRAANETTKWIKGLTFGLTLLQVFGVAAPLFAQSPEGASSPVITRMIRAADQVKKIMGRPLIVIDAAKLLKKAGIQEKDLKDPGKKEEQYKFSQIVEKEFANDQTSAPEEYYRVVAGMVAAQCFIVDYSPQKKPIVVVLSGTHPQGSAMLKDLIKQPFFPASYANVDLSKIGIDPSVFNERFRDVLLNHEFDHVVQEKYLNMPQGIMFADVAEFLPVILKESCSDTYAILRTAQDWQNDRRTPFRVTVFEDYAKTRCLGVMHAAPYGYLFNEGMGLSRFDDVCHHTYESSMAAVELIKGIRAKNWGAVETQLSKIYGHYFRQRQQFVKPGLSKKDVKRHVQAIMTGLKQQGLGSLDDEALHRLGAACAGYYTDQDKVLAILAYTAGRGTLEGAIEAANQLFVQDLSPAQIAYLKKLIKIKEDILSPGYTGSAPKVPEGIYRLMPITSKHG